MAPRDGSSDSDSALFVRRIKEEIDRLTCEQDEAIKTATFLGMTAQQERQFHVRRGRITRLIEQLAIFEEVQ
ncbi:MAG TPA: hypothetical protein VLW06_05575 [Terriglobales bacterium]|nr:hypothetical protein [Terriglobales bacterium]